MIIITRPGTINTAMSSIYDIGFVIIMSRHVHVQIILSMSESKFANMKIMLNTNHE